VSFTLVRPSADTQRGRAGKWCEVLGRTLHMSSKHCSSMMAGRVMDSTSAAPGPTQHATHWLITPSTSRCLCVHGGTQGVVQRRKGSRHGATFAVFQGTSNGGQRCANLRP